MDAYGPNSAEVAAFIAAAGRLTPSQWRKVAAARRSSGLVIKDTSGQTADDVRAMVAASEQAPGGDAAGHRDALAAAMSGVLEGRADDEVLAAWQAASGLARRRQLAALTFAAHYAPFASVIPAPTSAPVPPEAERFIKALRWLDQSQWQALARPWTLDRDSSTALLQAAAKSSTREAEEAAALAAIAAAPKHLAGDAGWAAVKTAAHASRVLGCRAELTPDQLAALWAPVEGAIALRALEAGPATRPSRPRTRKAAEPAAEAQSPPPKKRAAARRGPAYGTNHPEVAALIKAVQALTPIQWLRVLDRRQLVASVTRERSSEPAPVVRASLAAICGTRGLDLEQRCAVLSAVERAAFALESRAHLAEAQAREHYGRVEEVVPFSEVDAASFAGRLQDLEAGDWVRMAGVVPAVDVAATAPLTSAGDALADHLRDRSDEEVAVTWQALTALLHRHRLSPIKFAASFAPFASVVIVVKPKALAPVVQGYLTAIGRLSSHQCSLLAEPWLVADDVSNTLSKAMSDGITRPAEEVAALAALVTVPMRLGGDAGWAAAKTAAYGARVLACRERLTPSEFEQLWKPLERALPPASLETGMKRPKRPS